MRLDWFAAAPTLDAALVALLLLWVSPVRCETEFFKHFGTVFHSGIVAFPQAELSRYFNTSPVFAIGFMCPYYGNWAVHAVFQYARLDESLTSRILHFAKTSAGIAYKPKHPAIPGLGVGVGNYFLRSAKLRDSLSYLLDDNESEFGGYPFLYWEFSPFKKLIFRLETVWDVILSEPKYTHLPTVHVGVGWYWW